MAWLKPKPVREWAISKGIRAFGNKMGPVSETRVGKAFYNLIDRFYLKKSIKVSELKFTSLKNKLVHLGVYEFSPEHGDLLRNEEHFYDAILNIEKNKKLTYFDIFKQQKSGSPQADVAAIQQYYRINTGQNLENIQTAEGKTVGLHRLSAEQLAWMRNKIESDLNAGKSLTLALDFTGKSKPATAAPTGGKSWTPKASRSEWAAAGAAVAGLAIGAHLLGNAAGPSVKDYYAGHPKTLTRTAQQVVAANYKQSKNFGVPLVPFATEWEAHKLRLPARVASSPKYYSAKFMQQWDAYVQRLARGKSDLKVTPQMAYAFLKSRVLGTQGRSAQQEAWLIVNNAFRK